MRRARTVGGVYYRNAVHVPGGVEPSPVTAIVPADKERDAMKAVVETIDPKKLAISERVLSLIPPTAYGHISGRSELFQKRTSPVFDPVGAAEIAADVAISPLLEPNRATRTINQNAGNKQSPHFQEVVDALINATWKIALPGDANLTVLQRATRMRKTSKIECDFYRGNNSLRNKIGLKAVVGYDSLTTRRYE